MKQLLLWIAVVVSFNLCITCGSNHGQGAMLWGRQQAAFSHSSNSQQPRTPQVSLKWRVTPFQLPQQRRQQSLMIQVTENSNDTEESVSPSTDAVAGRQRRRRRRKQQSPLVKNVASQSGVEGVEEEDVEEWEEEEEEEESPKTSWEFKPRENTAVALEINDVRAVVGSSTPNQDFASSSSSSSKSPTTTSKKDQTSFSSTTPGRSSTATNTDNNNSLERLLADARQMKIKEEEEKDDDDQQEEGFSIPTSVKSILSTVITVDFFVVCAFLVWFLAGVFSSYVLDSDDVQIAFNNNFETLVQPALGLLMVGSVASAFFNDPEDGEAQ